MQSDLPNDIDKLKVARIILEYFVVSHGLDGDIITDAAELSPFITGNQDGIDVNHKVSLEMRVDRKEIPIKFGCCRYFSLNQTYISSLNNSPTFVDYFSCHNTMITSLDGGPEHCSEYSARGNHGLESLSGLPKECNSIGLSHKDNLGYLGLMKIKYLDSIVISPPGLNINLPIGTMLTNVVRNNNLNVQQKMLLAKRELINAGYEGNAKL